MFTQHGATAPPHWRHRPTPIGATAPPHWRHRPAPIGATAQRRLAPPPHADWRHRPTPIGATAPRRLAPPGGPMAPFVAVSALNQRKTPQTEDEIGVPIMCMTRGAALAGGERHDVCVLRQAGAYAEELHILT
jgi:hypothetical protein